MIEKLNEINLNKLLILYFILKEKSVSLAAQRLDLTPPTVSAALKFLRKFFDDQLLIRVSVETNILTSKGRLLLPELDKSLKTLLNVYNIARSNIHEKTTRHIKIGMTEPIAIMFSDEIVAELSNIAPNISLHTDILHYSLETKTYDHDLIITTRLTNQDNYHKEFLYRGELVVAASKRHEIFTLADLTKEQLYKYPILHMQLVDGLEDDYKIMDYLGISANIDANKDSVKFSSTNILMNLQVLSKSNYITFIGKNIARKYKNHFDIDFRESPCTLPIFNIMLFSHESDTDDQIINLLKKIIKKISLKYLD
ncbi:MAG TPA: LysR family transcriptional regulator [Victivallales bacterium]|nr:LysR family transcriptional regulator [Victivallales bacterium]